MTQIDNVVIPRVQARDGACAKADRNRIAPSRGKARLPSKANGATRNRSSVFWVGGGAGGIRTLDTGLPYTHFPGVRLRPLGHCSALCFCTTASLLECKPVRAASSLARNRGNRPRSRALATNGRPCKPIRVVPDRQPRAIMVNESHWTALRGMAFPANAASRAPFRPRKRAERGFLVWS